MRTDLGFRLDPTWTFLNHGSFGACPAPVIEAQAAWRDRLERQPVRFLDRELPGLLVEVRDRLGAFLHADPEGLVFVPNATTGVNAVMRSLTFQPGDEILTTDHEYNAVINTLRAVADPAGATVRLAQIPLPVADEATVVDAVVGAMSERTRLLVISHVTSPTALVLPVERIVAAARARGVDTLIDGAHAPGMVPLDLDALGAAYYTGNAHKWLCAPKGAGFLWVRPDRRDGVLPTVTSHGANDPRPDVPALRKRFDWVGTVDPTATLSIPTALDAVAALDPDGWPGIMAASHARAVGAGTMLAGALEVSPLAPDSMLGAMVAVPVPWLRTDADAVACKQRLEAERIEIPLVGVPVRAARDGIGADPVLVVVRVSTPPYVEPADIERLAEVMVRLRPEAAA